jgi:anti-anti-sigma regulatory factor
VLRITRTNPTGTCEVLTLEGRLVGPWVAECSRQATAALAAAPRVVIDLAHVTYADTLGIALLRNLGDGRAELRGGSGFINGLLIGARS